MKSSNEKNSLLYFIYLGVGFDGKRPLFVQCKQHKHFRISRNNCGVMDQRLKEKSLPIGMSRKDMKQTGECSSNYQSRRDPLHGLQ